MKKLIFLFIPLLFLSSCSIDWNDEKDKKIAELERQIQENTAVKIKKDSMCKRLLPEIKKQMEVKIDTKETQSTIVVEDIFYSPYMNDCVFITNELSQKTYTSRMLFLLTTKFWYSPSVLSCQTSTIYPEWCDSFDFWLQKIKWANESIPTKLDMSPVHQI